MPAAPTPFTHTAAPALQYIFIVSPWDADRELPLLPEVRKYQVSLLFSCTRHTWNVHLLMGNKYTITKPSFLLTCSVPFSSVREYYTPLTVHVIYETNVWSGRWLCVLWRRRFCCWLILVTVCVSYSGSHTVGSNESSVWAAFYNRIYRVG